MLKQFKHLLTLSFLAIHPLLLTGCQTWWWPSHHKGGFEQAEQSYAIGNYSRAFQELWLPVQAMDPRAMYAMGYMYYYGIGTNKDEDIALTLIRAAAYRNCPSAVIALKILSRAKDKQYAPLEKANSFAPWEATA